MRYCVCCGEREYRRTMRRRIEEAYVNWRKRCGQPLCHFNMLFCCKRHWRERLRFCLSAFCVVQFQFELKVFSFGYTFLLKRATFNFLWISFLWPKFSSKQGQLAQINTIIHWLAQIIWGKPFVRRGTWGWPQAAPMGQKKMPNSRFVCVVYSTSVTPRSAHVARLK